MVRLHLAIHARNLKTIIDSPHLAGLQLIPTDRSHSLLIVEEPGLKSAAQLSSAA